MRRPRPEMPVKEPSRILELPKDEAIVAERLRRRESLFEPQLLSQVQALFTSVKERGDRAVLDATRTHDGVTLAALSVSSESIDEAVNQLPPELRQAIEVARERIERVNRGLLPTDAIRELEPGVRVGELFRPLDSVALWVPSRKGPLLSTALMLVAAARVASVPRILVLMPPRADGTADPGTLAAARLAGAHEREEARQVEARQWSTPWVFRESSDRRSG
jgi:histidinol dehydrogenase